MAIDPTIALGVRPLESPIDSMGKAVSLQNMRTQGSMAQLGLQQAQTQMSQQQALNAAYADPANRNPDGSINYAGVQQSLAKAGAGAQIPGTVKAGMEAQKAQMDMQESHLKLMAAHNSNMADHIQGLMGDKALTPDKVKAVMDQSLQSGDLDQAHYQQALQTMPQTTDPNALKAWLSQQATQVYATGAKLQAFLPQTKVETIGGQAIPVSTTQATGQVTAGAPVATAPESELGKINQDVAAGRLSESEAAAARRKATYIQPNAITIMNQAGGGGNFDASKPLPPAQEAQARMIADGGSPMTPSSRNPYALPINARAQQLFSEANGGDMTGFGTLHGTLSKGRGSFMPGGTNGQTLTALDTTIHHLGLLDQYGKALQNGDTQIINSIGNAIAQQTGSPAPTNFETARQVAMDEFAKAAAGSGVTQGDREKAAAVLSKASSPAQLSGAIEAAQNLMAGKLVALQQQYQNVNGPNADISKKVTPETRAAMTRAGFKAPSSAPPTITNQADYDKLPQGASYLDSSGALHKKGGGQ